MRKPGNLYSRFVRLAKIAFPLAALAVLSTLFLFTRTIDPTDAIPFADVNVEQIAKDQILRAPRFSAVTRDGTEITVTADLAMPDAAQKSELTAQNIQADLGTLAGVSYNILSRNGVFDDAAKTLDLEGMVQITTSDGYVLTTEEITADLAETRLSTRDSVRGDGPGGSIEAGRMQLTRTDDTQLLVFTDGVKLIYTPEMRPL